MQYPIFSSKLRRMNISQYLRKIKNCIYRSKERSWVEKHSFLYTIRFVDLLLVRFQLSKYKSFKTEFRVKIFMIILLYYLEVTYNIFFNHNCLLRSWDITFQFFKDIEKSAEERPISSSTAAIFRRRQIWSYFIWGEVFLIKN